MVSLCRDGSQLAPVFHTHFEQRNGSLQIFHVLAPFVVEHLLGSQHLGAERTGKQVVAPHVVLQAQELMTVAGDTIHCRNSSQCFLTMGHALVDNIQGQFALVLLVFPLFLYILNEFLALRTTTLVETGIDGIFIGIHQFTHLHTQQERLTVTFGDSETAEQLRSYLSALVVSLQQPAGIVVTDSIIERELLQPVVTVFTAVAVPGIASPDLIPHPVAINLQLAAAVGKFVGGIGPVPIAGLRIEMETFGMMDAVHGLHGFLRKGRRRPSPRLQIGQDMHIVNMHRCSGSQLLVGFSPRTTGLVGGQRFTRVFRHGIDVGIERQRFLQHQRAVGVVRTQDDGRLVGSARGLQSVLDSWNNGFLHPFHIIINSSHGLTETDQEAHLRVFLHERSYRLAGVVADERRDRTVTVLRLQSVVVGKGFREDDIIEHLNNTDATAVSLLNEEREHILILLHRGIVHLGSKRIVVELHQRGKGMTVPEIHRIHIVGCQHVEVLDPEGFVVEPWEILRRVRVFIDPMAGQIDRLLQPHTGSAEHHLGGFGDGGESIVGTVHQIVFLQAVYTVDHAGAVISRDGNLAALPFDGKTFSRGSRGGYAEGDGVLAVECFQQRSGIFCLRHLASLLYLDFGRDREATG